LVRPVAFDAKDSRADGYVPYGFFVSWTHINARIVVSVG
jgi:hypothetical protein